MKQNSYKLAKAGMLGAVLFFSASVALAATWTPPTSAPPNGNVDAPLNASINAQYKAGALAVGKTTNPTAGSTLDVNGVTSTNGFANFGTAEMLGKVHIGTSACGSGCVGGAVAPPSGTTMPGGTSSPTGSLEKYFAVRSPALKTSLLGNVFSSITSSFAEMFTPNKAYALYSLGGGTTVTPVDPVGPSGGTDTFAPAPVMITMTAATPVISQGMTDSITWSASNAGSCTVSSSISTSNVWSGTIATSGTRSFAAFTAMGSYTYTISCTNSTIGGTGGSASATITVGPSYLLQVDGNTRTNGQADVTGSMNVGGVIKQGGVAVCLQDGTNCSVSSIASGTVNTISKFTTTGNLGDSSITDDGTNVAIGGRIHLKSDQGGSIELGGNGSAANVSGGMPYIDFHYGGGSAQDYNVRLINNGNGHMDFQNSTGTVLSLLNDSQAVSVKNSVPIYLDLCQTGGKITLNSTTGCGTNTLKGYLLPPPAPAPATTSLVLNTTFSSPISSMSHMRTVYINLVYSIATPFISTTWNGPTDYSYDETTIGSGATSGSGTATLYYTSLSCGSTYTVRWRGYPSGASPVWAQAGTNMSGSGATGLSFTVPSC